MSPILLIWLFSLLSSSTAYSRNLFPMFDGNLDDILTMLKEHVTKIREKLANVENAEDVLMRMLDSSSKIPTGVLNGNLYDLGNFDECYNIHSDDIYGKYCLGTFHFDPSINQILNRSLPHQILKLSSGSKERSGDMNLLASVQFRWAACVPSNMKAGEINYLYQTYTEDFCYSKATEPELSAGAITTIVILSIFLFIIVISTIFDTYLHYTKKESPHELLIAFSFLSNGRKLFTSTTNPDQLLCLNGIKAISMMWVIIGHEYSVVMSATVSNMLDILNYEEDAANMYMKAATLSVDTFFVVGGLLTVYAFLRAHDKGVKFNIFLYYLHRYLRLTPAFGIVILINLFLIPYVANGPLWKFIDYALVQTCKDYWWASFFYISNYVMKGACVPPTWYLSVDMQLFILSPIILIPLIKWPKYVLGALGLLTIAGIVVPFTIVYVEDIGTQFSTDGNRYQNLYYIQTYNRFATYVIGMILGYLIYHLKKSKLKVHLQPVTVILLWLVTLTGLVACVYGGYNLVRPSAYDRLGNSFYVAFDRPAWGVALGGVILLCVAGYGGPINHFLSLPVFQFLTKLSYSMYLVHSLVVAVSYFSMRNLFMFSDIYVMHHFWGDFMATLVISLVLCLSFESPVIILEKYIFGRGPKQPNIKKQEI